MQQTKYLGYAWDVRVGRGFESHQDQLIWCKGRGTVFRKRLLLITAPIHLVSKRKASSDPYITGA